MNKVTQSVIETLTERSGSPKLTIYMPTHNISTPPTIQEDSTRLKNLVREGCDKLTSSVSEEQLKPIADNLNNLLDDESVLQAPSHGLAIFADDSGVEYYHLPIECESRAHVGDKFDLTPLHVALGCDQPHYVLALAMHNSKLFKGDAYGLEHVEIDFPSSPEDALNIDEMFANSNTQRGYEGPASSGYAISTHGAGDSHEAGREERLQYFRIIDAMLNDPKYVDTGLPILIAATESEAGDYKAASKSQKLLQNFLHGNHTKTELHELHAHTWPLVKSELSRAKVETLVDQFNEKKGIQKASSDVDDIRQAVEAGRVDTLMVFMLESTNDSVNDTSETGAPLIRFDERYDQSNISDLATAVIAQGGNVVGVDVETFDVPSMAAAIYRY